MYVCRETVEGVKKRVIAQRSIEDALGEGDEARKQVWGVKFNQTNKKEGRGKQQHNRGTDKRNEVY